MVFLIFVAVIFGLKSGLKQSFTRTPVHVYLRGANALMGVVLLRTPDEFRLGSHRLIKQFCRLTYYCDHSHETLTPRWKVDLKMLPTTVELSLFQLSIKDEINGLFGSFDVSSE